MLLVLDIIILLLLALWLFKLLIRRTFRFSNGWAIALICSLVVGICVSIPLQHFEVQISSSLRFYGLPFPNAVHHLENGTWIDFVFPFYRYIIIANIINVLFLSFCLFLKVHFRFVMATPS